VAGRRLRYPMFPSSISILQTGQRFMLITSVLRHDIRAYTHQVQDGSLDLAVLLDCFQHLSCELSSILIILRAWFRHSLESESART